MYFLTCFLFDLSDSFVHLLSCSALLPFLGAASQCGPVSGGSPLWLTSRILGSRFLQPLQTFAVSGPCSRPLLEKAEPLLFPLWSRNGLLCSGLWGPCCCPMSFSHRDRQHTGRVAVGDFPPPTCIWLGCHLIFCKCGPCVLFCHLSALCFSAGSWGDLSLIAPSSQNPPVLPFYWFCQ